MLAYTLRRLLLIIPTLMMILLVNFVIVQAAPAARWNRPLPACRGSAAAGVGALGGGGDSVQSASRASRGLDPKLIADIERQYGFDKPAPERFWLMLKHYASLGFRQEFLSWRPGHRPDPGKKCR